MLKLYLSMSAVVAKGSPVWFCAKSRYCSRLGLPLTQPQWLPLNALKQTQRTKKKYLTRVQEHFKKLIKVRTSVADPWHFGTDPDPQILIPLTNCSGFGSDSGSGSGSCYFRQWSSRWKKNLFCLLLFEATFTSFFKDTVKKSQRGYKTVGIKVFLIIFALW